MSKHIGKIIVISIIAIILGYYGLLIFGWMSTSVDDSLIEKTESQEYFMEFTDYSNTCQMPNCKNQSDKYIKLTIKSQFKRHANIQIDNEAGFTLQGGKGEFHNNKSYTESEKYLHITEQHDGSYNASIETEYVEVPYKDKYENYYTTVEGYYCADHSKQAKDIVSKELASAMKSNIIYILGYKCSPWTFLLFPILFVIFISTPNPIRYLDYYTDAAKSKFYFTTFVVLPIVSAIIIYFYYRSTSAMLTFLLFALACIPIFKFISNVSQFLPPFKEPTEEEIKDYKETIGRIKESDAKANRISKFK